MKYSFLTWMTQEGDSIVPMQRLNLDEGGDRFADPLLEGLGFRV